MYDLAVIGGGPAGYNAALHGASLGLKTVLIEREKLGGACLNRGCIPTKSLLKSSELYKEATEGEAFGILCDNVKFDLEKIYQRKDKVVEKLRKGIEYLIKKSGLDYIQGEAQFIDKHTLKVNDSLIEAQYILIACGSRPAQLRAEGAEYAVNSDDILKNAVIENDILIIGGGVIGVEFASFFSNLGKNVTILEYENSILPRFDIDAINALTMSLKKRGVKLVTGAQVSKIVKENKLKVAAKVGDLEQEFFADKVIVSVGRKSNIESLNLEKAGVIYKDIIFTDKNLRTNVDNIFSAGDISSNIKLAHFAEAQGVCAVDIIAKRKPSFDLSIIPSVVYTSPEIATVGKIVEDGEKLYFSKVFMNTNGKASIEDSSGFVKIAFDENKIIVGAVIVNARASELIGEMALAVTNKLTLDDLSKTIHPHPTLSEAIRLCAEEGIKLLGGE